MTAALTSLGWADPHGRTPSDRQGVVCRVCGKSVCSHPDAVFAGIVPAASSIGTDSAAPCRTSGGATTNRPAGVVVIDDVSDPGSWARHLRHTQHLHDRDDAHRHSPTETEARNHDR